MAKLVDMSQVQGRKMYQKQGQEQQDMRRELSMEIKEFRQQLNVLFKHIAEKDLKKHSS